MAFVLSLSHYINWKAKRKVTWDQQQMWKINLDHSVSTAGTCYSPEGYRGHRRWPKICRVGPSWQGMSKTWTSGFLCHVKSSWVNSKNQKSNEISQAQCQQLTPSRHGTLFKSIHGREKLLNPGQVLPSNPLLSWFTEGQMTWSKGWCLRGQGLRKRSGSTMAVCYGQPHWGQGLGTAHHGTVRANSVSIVFHGHNTILCGFRNPSN